MKYSGFITVTSIVQLVVSFIQAVFSMETATPCPVPLGPYAETCKESMIYLPDSGDSKSMIPYNLDNLKSPNCIMITACNSQNDTVVFNNIEYPPHIQYTDVTNLNGVLHQNGLNLREYSSSQVKVYNLMKQKQIIEQREENTSNRGRLREKVKTNKLLLCNT